MILKGMNHSTRPTIVCGCQRSGTLLASHVLADFYEGHYVDEFEFIPIEEGIKAVNKLVKKGFNNLIVHCPVALRCWEEIYHKVPNVRFVGVRRNKEDVLKSMRRIKWLLNDNKDNYDEFLNSHYEEMISYWEDLKEIVPSEDWREIQYEDLQDHPFFIDKKERKNFHVKQWQVGDPRSPRYWDDDRKLTEIELKKRGSYKINE